MRKTNKNTRYFNFPIQILKDFLLDKKMVLENIFDYAIFAKAQSFKSNIEIQNGKDALKYFGVPSSDLELTLQVGKLIFEKLPENSPKVGLNKDIWLKFCKNETSDFENVTLLAFLALKSILGQKPYCKVVNNYWLARMDGKRYTIKSYDELSTGIKKYANEYQLGKIKQALVDSWGLKTYSYHTRGFYISFDLTIKELALKAEMLRKSNIALDYKSQIKEAREEALEKIKGRTTIARPI